MNQSWLRMKRALVLLSLGGTTLGIFGGQGCLYPTNADYFNLFKASGNAVIQAVSDNFFGNFSKNYDAFVRTPTTTFAQSVWSNWLDARIPDDLPNNAVVQR